MVAFDTGATLAARFRAHARDATHLYGYAIRGMADDWEAGGPVATLLRGYEDAPPGSVLQLRLLAALFRLVLTGQAPELVGFYPCLGGDEPAAQAWPVMRRVMAANPDPLRQALEIAPQTNEVGRSAALLAGLAGVVRATGTDRVRLLEPGASAGLNLLVDHFWFSGAPSWSWGDPGSPVRLEGAIEPVPEGPDLDPPAFAVVERRGCDLHPVDATTSQGRLLLTSFVWPFMVERHRRLAAAFDVVAAHPVHVEQAGAADWLAAVLDEPPVPGVLDVVWQSITQLYWPPAEVTRVAQVLAGAGRDRPLAHVSMEYAPGNRADAEPEITTTCWDGRGGAPYRRLVGTAHDHGVPVHLLGPDR